jgi:predicted nucleotidyltransferase component of viral defense system
MNTTWTKLSKEKKIETLSKVSDSTKLSEYIIEKDWWVTLALKAAFSTSCKENMIFKGGTSLSKGYDLIERFSEDVDLAIDREFFGFDDAISKNQIKRTLRKQSCNFISTTFLEEMKNIFEQWNVLQECEIIAQPIKDSDKDPQTIEIHYNSVFSTTNYVAQKVLIEISCRSLTEPAEKRPINSILSNEFPALSFSNEAFDINTTLPKKTFLEKIFLLHEKFANPSTEYKDRYSRHLYDLIQLMDTKHGRDALQDTELYKTIITHREKFNPIRGFDYSANIYLPSKINIIPSSSHLKDYEKDYEQMRKSMIYGNPPNFKKLMDKIKELQQQINLIQL